MNYKSIKKEFIELKKEELEYIDNIYKNSINKTLSEYEKLEIYRNIENYKTKLNEVLKRLREEVIKNGLIDSLELEDVIIEFDVDKNWLSSINIHDQEYTQVILKRLGIDINTSKFRITLFEFIHYSYVGIDYNMLLYNQELIENPIYIFCGYYDSSEDCYGPLLGEPDDYIYGIYKDIHDRYSKEEEISKKYMQNFESDKIIIDSKRYVYPEKIRKMFEEELLNDQNKTIDDCVIATRNRIEVLNQVRSPEYKEKVLLDKINELYKRVKGEFIQKEVLYSGNFLEIIRETYKLPNEKIVKKEKVIKNGGKNSVIVIALTEDKYIITFQNRIKDKLIAEFPSGYIEKDEEPLEAAKRELQEESGYTSDDLFIIDEVYTSPGIDNSTTYIVIANNCAKTNKKIDHGTELVNYELFSEVELKYIINNDIMNGAMNKLAYYNLINNADKHIDYINGNKKIYKMRLKEKIYTLDS